MRGDVRADACPGVLRLHDAADGRLARVRLPGGRLHADALAALARAAALGNDIVELTSRAGLQLRGLHADDERALVALLGEGGLLPSRSHERVRNILAPPLAGRDPAALAPLDALVAQIDRALCADAALAELPGRFLFAVEDGVGALRSVRADVELRARREAPAAPAAGSRTGSRAGVFCLHLDGLATSGLVAAAGAHDAALDAARAFLALRRELAPGAWHVRELPGGGARLARELGLTTPAPADGAAGAHDPHARARVALAERHRRLGLHVQRDGRLAVCAMPPLARLDGAQLLRLSQLASAYAADVRVSPWRTLAFVDLTTRAAPRLARELEDVGLAVRDGSGWDGLSACAGLGACARARTDVRTLARARAAERDASSPSEHWSACERRCGEPSDVVVSHVAAADGTIVVGRPHAPAPAPTRTGAPA